MKWPTKIPAITVALELPAFTLQLVCCMGSISVQGTGFICFVLLSVHWWKTVRRAFFVCLFAFLFLYLFPFGSEMLFKGDVLLSSSTILALNFGKYGQKCVWLWAVFNKFLHGPHEVMLFQQVLSWQLTNAPGNLGMQSGWTEGLSRGFCLWPFGYTSLSGSVLQWKEKKANRPQWGQESLL